jgi:hypothetical protein
MRWEECGKGVDQCGIQLGSPGVRRATGSHAQAHLTHGRCGSGGWRDRLGPVVVLCWRPRLIGYRVPHEVLG